MVKNTKNEFAVLFSSAKVILSKLMLGALALFFFMLFSAVVEGGISLALGLALGACALALANFFCGMLLPVECSETTAAKPTPAPVRVQSAQRTLRPTVPLRVVHGGRAA